MTTTTPVAFFEVTSPDAPRAQRFYSDLFGWQITPDPTTDGYALVDTGAGDDAVSGGIGPSTSADDRGVKIYVRVPDVEAHLEKAGALGAPTLLPPMDLPGGYGRIAVVADPDGNPVGLWS